jgi:hypothetical protein
LIRLSRAQRSQIFTSHENYLEAGRASYPWSRTVVVVIIYAALVAAIHHWTGGAA